MRLPHRYIILAWDTCVTFPNLCAKVANIIVAQAASTEAKYFETGVLATPVPALISR